MSYWTERYAARKEAGICTKCGGLPLEMGKLYCSACGEKTRQRQRENNPYQRRKSLGVCVLCGKGKPHRSFVMCAECHQKRNSRKSTVLEHYGGCCRCCGETIVDFLELDHVNNDGGQHRKHLKLSGGDSFYRWVINEGFPDQFQILCSNCNKGKYRNGGVCPHELYR